MRNLGAKLTSSISPSPVALLGNTARLTTGPGTAPAAVDMSLVDLQHSQHEMSFFKVVSNSGTSGTGVSTLDASIAAEAAGHMFCGSCQCRVLRVQLTTEAIP